MSEDGVPHPDDDTQEGPDRSGTLLNGRYQLDERIGVGGMGEVWRATDTLLSRPVAVKVLHAAQMAEPISRERFRTEARISAGLSHPGIAQVYDYGEQNDTAFLVMELVCGEPLSAIIRRDGGLEPGAALGLLAQAAHALGAAHARGVVHRDIKPGNLLVTEDGTVKLTDFGIARGDESVTLTQTGMVMGTAQYISPEQASGQSATHSSDVYSLGVVAYECLAGTPPFTADAPLALALAHVRDEPPPLPEHIAQPVQDLVLGMLAKSAADRPSSAVDVAQTAQQLRDTGTVPSRPDAATSVLTAPAQTAVMSGAAVGAGATRGGQGDAATQPGESLGPASSDGAGDSATLAPGSRRIPRAAVIGSIVAVLVLAAGALFLGQWLSGGEEPSRPAGNEQQAERTAPTDEEEPTEEPEPEEPVVEQAPDQGDPAPEPEEAPNTEHEEPTEPTPEQTPDETGPDEPDEPDEPTGEPDEDTTEPDDQQEDADSGEEAGE
ncbi:protein kinase [Lipingzhangella sp. LS1_29]|uniref:non-specific serine/threonine protein kinase n=1 Tax=Lipingzhangella rawalii TaxID=2055835 RepID=A0ABU2H8Q3_9ACTN|nr:protein kinase [Lipingzhangella rawalii]MDS1271653.1 protein kinase [Lipingzhangella rawalii]